MLLANILFELYPIVSGVAHLREKRRLVLTGRVPGIERVITQFARIDPRSFSVGQTIRHAKIIA